MKKAVALVVVIAGAVAGLAVAWNTIREDREFQRLMAHGDAAMAREQSFVAIEAFSGALALKPGSMIAFLKRGDAYYRRGELAAALRDLRAAASLDPSASRPKELLGDVNLALGRYDRAIEAYAGYLTLDDQAARVLYKLALSYHRSGRARDAIEPLRQSIALDRRFAEAHYLMALCVEPASIADALKWLASALDVQPSFAAAREEMARLLARDGRVSESIRQLEELAAREPNRPQRAVVSGLALANAGRTEMAIVRLGRAAEQFPDEPLVYTALGRVWLLVAESRGDRVAATKAREALGRFTESESASSELLTLYGRTQLLLGDMRGAERTFESAVARFPVDPEAFAYLSRTAARLGHDDVARNALRSYEVLAKR